MNDLYHQLIYDEKKITVKLESKYIYKLIRFLLLIVAALVILSITGQLYKVLGPHFSDTLIEKFNLDGEGGIPAYFSGILLLAAGVFLGCISFLQFHQKAVYQKKWSMLSFIFLLLSVDELTSLHEMLMEPVRSLFQVSGFFYFAWVLPVGLALLALVISYIPFLINLPAKIRVWFIISGSVYVFGAFGMEMVGANYVAEGNYNLIIYSLITTVEESLEMIGMVVFIYTLLEVIKLNLRGIDLYLPLPNSVGTNTKKNSSVN